MVEILKSFEQVAIRFSPAVLVVPGLVVLAMGLFVWLAGVCRKRLWLGLVGALTGGLAAFFFGGQNPAMAGLAAGGSAAFGAIAPRLFSAVLLAVLGATIAFGVIARTCLFSQQGALSSGRNLDPPARRFTTQESLDAVQAYVLDVADRIKAIVHGLASVDVVVIVAVGAGLLAVGLIFGRLAGALACSMVGSGLVFAGLTLLLIFKGATPIARMEQQGPFYGLVLLGMVAFGTLEQLLLCPQARDGRAPRSAKRRTEERESKRGWRNR
ncbi:MAG: hypothetical protein KBE65_14050 [Phycisphaerae bacterium]|nr:hypothetical protein [Phycisphaerae bacterium]